MKMLYKMCSFFSQLRFFYYFFYLITWKIKIESWKYCWTQMACVHFASQFHTFHFLTSHSKSFVTSFMFLFLFYFIFHISSCFYPSYVAMENLCTCIHAKTCVTIWVPGKCHSASRLEMSKPNPWARKRGTGSS